VENGRFGSAITSFNGFPVIGVPREDVGATPQAGRVYTFAPAISFVDGRNGETYPAPNGIPGTNHNPVGRFSLESAVTGAALESVTISDASAPPSGITSVELWTSDDTSFDPAADTEIASAAYANELTFSGLANPIPAGGHYVFVVTDLDASASGDYEPVIRDETAVEFSGGQLTEYNGAQTSTFTDAFLSDAATPLPVEFAQFSARANGDDRVVLTWSTLSETENTGFYVQRTVSTSKESWSELAFVEGAGTSRDVQSYRFTDTKLPPEVETLTYRLRQVDVDGVSSLTDPVTVSIGTKGGFGIMKTYPNPAQSQVTIELNVPNEMAPDGATLRMYDILGRQVRTFDGIAGSVTKTIQTRDLPSGTYFLRLEANGRSAAQQVTVVR
jgi:hypothetical protein